MGLLDKKPKKPKNKLQNYVSNDIQTSISKNTNSSGKKKSGISTSNSTTKIETKCADGACGTGTLNKQKKEKVEGGKQKIITTKTIVDTPYAPPTTSRTKQKGGKLYANISGGSDGIPAFNVGEKIGKLLNASPFAGENNGGKMKTPDTISSDQEGKGKGKTGSSFGVTVGYRKNGKDKDLLSVGKKVKNKK